MSHQRISANADPRDQPLVQRLTLQEIDSGRTFDAEVGWKWMDTPIVDLDGGKPVDINNLCYSINKTVTVEGDQSLEKSVMLRVKPLVVQTIRGFTEGEVEASIYPPSSALNYERFMGSDIDVRLIIQEELDSNNKWLLILGEDDSRLIHHHPLYEYEVFYQSFLGKNESILRSSSRRLDTIRRFKFRKSLEELPTPSWQELYNLTEGYDVQEIKLGRNMRETVDQFIPSEWHEFIRDSYIQGLSAILSKNLMSRDPLDYVDAFIESAISHTMIMEHFANIVKGKPSSDMVRIINKPRLSDKLTLEGKTPYKWWMPMREMENRFHLPDAESILIRHSLRLSDEQSTKPKFPVSWEEAKKDPQKFKERVVLIGHFPTMYGRFNPERLGLRSLLYLGGAYRWPHKHSTWSANAVAGKRNLQIQELLLPPHAVEKVTRFLERVLVTRWYSRRVNNDTFDFSKERWTYDPVRMARKVEGKVSMNKLVRDFNIGTPDKATIPDRMDASIIDGISYGLRYQEMELRKGLWEVLGVTPSEFETKARGLVNDGMMRLSYNFDPPRFTSRCLVLSGDMGRIRSLSYSLLKSAPTCSVYLFDDSAFIIVSLHPDKVDEFLETLKTSAAENGVFFETWTVNRFQNYRWGLLQRILKDDGTWDDDVSGLLCQGRGRGVQG
ncbi:MAG: hypothetical protein ACW99G_00950 [Candidatus Thorarchaeota archaeon]